MSTDSAMTLLTCNEMATAIILEIHSAVLCRDCTKDAQSEAEVAIRTLHFPHYSRITTIPDIAKFTQCKRSGANALLRAYIRQHSKSYFTPSSAASARQT
jgi:hypothetical protein